MVRLRPHFTVVVALVVVASTVATVPVSSTASDGDGDGSTADTQRGADVSISNATIDGSTDSTIEVTYNTSGISNPELAVLGPDEFSRTFSDDSLEQGGTKTVTIPANTYEEGDVKFRARLRGDMSQLMDDAVITVTYPEDDPEPAFEVIDAGLNRTAIEQGESVSVAATVENSGTAEGTYTAELVVNGSVVDRADVTVSEGDQQVVSFERTFEETGSFDVSVGDNDAGTLAVEAAATPTPTPTATPTPTPTATPSPTSTASPASTDTATATRTSTRSPSPTTSPTATRTAAGTAAEGDPMDAENSPTASPVPTETPGQPGFGLFAALVSLVAVGLLVDRRRDS